MLGQEVELVLRAVQQALADPAAGADREDRLPRVPAGARRIERRIDEREQALLLVAVQLEEEQHQRRSERPTPSVRSLTCSAQRDDSITTSADEEEEQRGAEVGLLR